MQKEKGDYMVLDVETTGLSPWYGDRVTMIGIKFSDKELPELYFTDSDEEAMLKRFWNWFTTQTHKFSYMVTKNGKMFDVPFILVRSFFFMDPFDTADEFLKFPHRDLHELTKRWVSLDDMTRLLQCEQKLGKGENAPRLWKSGNIEALKAYLRQDLRITMQVYERVRLLKNLQIIHKEINLQIQHHIKNNNDAAVNSLEYIHRLLLGNEQPTADEVDHANTQ